uniref:Virulence_fact domain-containing protein n=1 Tax=Heterorhabditis bacteriophora TaxID=37862 RepID=A0A1I7WMI5_HETBA
MVRAVKASDYMSALDDADNSISRQFTGTDWFDETRQADRKSKGKEHIEQEIERSED